MKRFTQIMTASAIAALCLTACGGNEDSSNGTEGTSEQAAPPAESAGAAESTATTEATPVEARVVVTSDSENAAHTVKERGDAEVNYDVPFDERAEIEFDNDIVSVYVAAEGDDATVSCEVWYEDEEVASDEATGEPARCWAPPAQG